MNFDFDYYSIAENMFEAFASLEIIFNKNIKNYSYKFLYVNSAFEKIFNIQSKNLLGKSMGHIFEKLDYILSSKYLDKIIKNEKIDIEYYYKTLNKYLKIRFFIIEKNKLGVFITEDFKEKKEEEYCMNRENFNKIFKESSIAMQFLNCQGELIDVNEAFLKMFNISNKNIFEKFNIIKEKCFNNLKNKLDNRQIITFQKEIDIKDYSDWDLDFSSKRCIEITLIKLSQNSGILVQMQDLTEMKRNTEGMKKLAYYDSLTGLPNRKYFAESLCKVLEKSCKNNKKTCVIFMDINKFKNINDNYGHNVGDLVLIEMSKRFKFVLKSGEMLARLGGDEFILYKSFVKQETMYKFIKRILSVFKAPFMLQNYSGNITTSLGISLYPKDGTIMEELIKKADIAMYSAKCKKGNSYEFFNKRILKKN
ncbi:cyclic di-GMP phosphodiesterase Gmr [Clostridium acetireducens DSM 10703]|uniref:Cyclic di-GMP phosphodiesterase Gmr n=1 Tax=Clostridium acetireducens DSM 10703 TaxID=1121290 RepID=A0A1E8EZX4_9CLOT|nr:GGDEF domain-containing protein [Clostridium acetireducens]OFI06724.1 cyclic di-GMP phosphodiesterase Gmr [Clostridium acetireducens DSM 10703]